MRETMSGTHVRNSAALAAQQKEWPQEERRIRRKRAEGHREKGRLTREWRMEGE